MQHDLNHNTLNQNKSKIQVGIINIMPNSVGYHQELIKALSCVADDTDLHWIRLDSKTYDNEAEPFLAEHYRNFDAVSSDIQLDALIVTGAPVETLAFNEVYYWEELHGIINTAISENLFTLGICWGALAIGNVLGLTKMNLEDKVFGVFGHQNQVAQPHPFGELPAELTIPLSIQARFIAEQTDQQVAQGKFATLASNPAIGHSLLQSSDKQHLLCIGHPEYGATRLIDEWKRDKQKQPDLAPPHGLDINNPEAFWRSSSDLLLQFWIDQVKEQKHNIAHRLTNKGDVKQSTSDLV